MEKVYDPKRYTNSGVVDHIQFLYTSSKNFMLPKTPYSSECRNQEIMELMGLEDKEEFVKLSEECNPDLLQGDDWKFLLGNMQKNRFVSIPVTKDALKLNTVERYVEYKERLRQPSMFPWHKYRSERRLHPQEPSTDSPLDLVPGENLIFKIKVYHPLKYVIGDRCHDPMFYHNLVVLGSQPLTVLKEKIICPNSLSSCIDTSENPDEQAIPAKDMFRSGFIFIENVFYNDMTSKDNLDYSECIVNWAKAKGIGELQKESMSNVTFNELNIKLGYPYVYRHMGDCEHLFTFSDIEVLQPSDSCSSSCYPMYTSCSLKKAHYCVMCGTFIAKWRVTESDRIPFDPAYYCDLCFHSYNYINGEKVGHFKAFSYIDSVNAI